jgi:hypothetical protein
MTVRDFFLRRLQERFILTCRWWSNPNGWLFPLNGTLFTVDNETTLRRYFPLWLENLERCDWNTRKDWHERIDKQGRPLPERFPADIGLSPAEVKGWYLRALSQFEGMIKSTSTHSLGFPTESVEIKRFFGCMRATMEAIRPGRSLAKRRVTFKRGGLH